ncbi:hypothetical protein ROZALSC1DRAFT_31231, partial [Rozella allomycis CSF55]
MDTNDGFICDPSYVSHMNSFVNELNDLQLNSVTIKDRIISESKSLGYALTSKDPSCLAKIRICNYKSEIAKVGLHVLEHNHAPSDKVLPLPDNVDAAILSFVQAQMNSFQIHTALQVMYPNNQVPLTTVADDLGLISVQF